MDVCETDYTPDFAATTRAWIDESDKHHGELAALIGEQSFVERQSERRAQLKAIEEGVLRRSLFTARSR